MASDGASRAALTRCGPRGPRLSCINLRAPRIGVGISIVLISDNRQRGLDAAFPPTISGRELLSPLKGTVQVLA